MSAPTVNLSNPLVNGHPGVCESESRAATPDAESSQHQSGPVQARATVATVSEHVSGRASPLGREDGPSRGHSPEPTSPASTITPASVPSPKNRTLLADYPPQLQTEMKAPVWKSYVDHTTTFDKEMVRRLNDTVDILMLFSTLFSAVLSAFLVLVYQTLQPDNSSLTLQALVVISGQLMAISEQSNGSRAVSTPPSFQMSTPTGSSSAIWINALWYIGLILSLSSSVVAMLVRTWLLSYEENLVPTRLDYPLRRHRRFEKLEGWHVRHIVSALPIILHVAVFLFFGGLVIFLWNVSDALGGIACGLCGVLTLLYILATVFPLIDLDCPYKSPLLKFLCFFFVWINKIAHVGGQSPNLPGHPGSSANANDTPLRGLPAEIARRVYEVVHTQKHEMRVIEAKRRKIVQNALQWLWRTASDETMREAVILASAGDTLEPDEPMKDALSEEQGHGVNDRANHAHLLPTAAANLIEKRIGAPLTSPNDFIKFTESLGLFVSLYLPPFKSSSEPHLLRGYPSRLLKAIAKQDETSIKKSFLDGARRPTSEEALFACLLLFYVKSRQERSTNDPVLFSNLKQILSKIVKTSSTPVPAYALFHVMKLFGHNLLPQDMLRTRNDLLELIISVPEVPLPLLSLVSSIILKLPSYWGESQVEQEWGDDFGKTSWHTYERPGLLFWEYFEDWNLRRRSLRLLSRNFKSEFGLSTQITLARKRGDVRFSQWYDFCSFLPQCIPADFDADLPWFSDKELAAACLHLSTTNSTRSQDFNAALTYVFLASTKWVRRADETDTMAFLRQPDIFDGLVRRALEIKLPELGLASVAAVVWLWSRSGSRDSFLADAALCKSIWYDTPWLGMLVDLKLTYLWENPGLSTLLGLDTIRDLLSNLVEMFDDLTDVEDAAPLQVHGLYPPLNDIVTRSGIKPLIIDWRAHNRLLTSARLSERILAKIV